MVGVEAQVQPSTSTGFRGRSGSHSLLTLNFVAQPCKRSANFPASLQAWHSYLFHPLEGFGLPWGPTSSGFLPLATEPLKLAEAFPVPGRVRLTGGEASSPGCCVRPGLSLGQAWEGSRCWTGAGVRVSSFQFRTGLGKGEGRAEHVPLGSGLDQASGTGTEHAARYFESRDTELCCCPTKAARDSSLWALDPRQPARRASVGSFKKSLCI